MAVKRTPKKPITSTPAAAPAPAPYEGPSLPDTHAFKFARSAYAACVCGAERDLVLRGGAAVRVYRPRPGLPWENAIAACPKSAGGVAPPPVRTPEPVRAAEQPAVPTVNIAAAFKKAYPDAFAPELIDGVDVYEAAKSVDLDVAFTPVIWSRDSIVPADVTQLEGGRYRVYVPDDGTASRIAGTTQDITADMLRVMRARFLLARGSFARSAARMEPELRARVERSLFPRGDVPWIAPIDSPLDRLAQDGVGSISIPREGDGPVDIAAVFTMLATPGAELPAVCPTVAEAPAVDPVDAPPRVGVLDVVRGLAERIPVGAPGDPLAAVEARIAALVPRCRDLASEDWAAIASTCCEIAEAEARRWWIEGVRAALDLALDRATGLHEMTREALAMAETATRAAQVRSGALNTPWGQRNAKVATLEAVTEAATRLANGMLDAIEARLKAAGAR